MGFAEALRTLMAERGMSQRTLARRVPCDKGLISRYVNGKQPPSQRMARLVDEALGAGGELAALAPRATMWRPSGLNGEFSPADEERLHHLAHEQCFIANSVKTQIVVGGTRASGHG